MPSRFWIDVRNWQRVLSNNLKKGDKVIEIGCAPGKVLSWIAFRTQAKVSGIEYSKVGFENTIELLGHLKIDADIRCEDVFETSFPTESFDVVYSAGLIEHFEDPRPIVEAHFRLCRPGGKVVISIPNFSGIYGSLLKRFDPEAYSIHNVQIMNAKSLAALAPMHLVSDCRTELCGKLSLWLINLPKTLPRAIRWGIQMGGNVFGLLQPIEIPFLCPLFVLIAEKKSDYDFRA